jgi:hypothetical protein
MNGGRHCLFHGFLVLDVSIFHSIIIPHLLTFISCDTDSPDCSADS